MTCWTQVARCSYTWWWTGNRTWKVCVHCKAIYWVIRHSYTQLVCVCVCESDRSHWAWALGLCLPFTHYLSVLVCADRGHQHALCTHMRAMPINLCSLCFEIIYQIIIKTNTTANGGSLGSLIDEEHS